MFGISFSELLHIAFWGIPTAICAFIIHAIRLHRFDRMLTREMQPTGQPGRQVESAQ